MLFQGGKTSFMLFIMVSVLILYLFIGGLEGVRRARGSRSFYSEQDKPDLLYAGGLSKSEAGRDDSGISAFALRDRKGNSEAP
ncbi:hypothetical protein ACFSQ7_39485 [Paenibacillus rhizoplanae]